MTSGPLPSIELSTPRLWIRKVSTLDAAFFLRLLNSPGWLTYIGDRQVHTEAAAAEYIRNRVLPGYNKPGYGSYAVGTHGTDEPLGFVGVFERDTLAAPDFGFAFLPEGQGLGYGYEASRALLRQPEILALPELLAITLPENDRSIRLLRKLGFQNDGVASNGGDVPLLRFRRCQAKIAAPGKGAAI